MDIAAKTNNEQAERVTPGWKHFPHGADIGVHGSGATAAKAFEQAALALTAISVDPVTIKQDIWIDIACEAPTLEDLLVEWLNAVIFEMATRHMVFGAFQVTIRNHHLTARAFGEPLDADRHEPAVESKGATYTALRVAQTANGHWDAQCVVDV